MIQRIQTIWLLAVVISGILLITGDIITFGGNEGLTYTFSFRGVEVFPEGETERSSKISAAFQIALISNILIAIVAILLFGKRRIQKILALVSALIAISLQILLIYIAFKTISDSEVHLKTWVLAALPALMALFSFLAWKGIDRDEKLVKSYDRLR